MAFRVTGKPTKESRQWASQHGGREVSAIMPTYSYIPSHVVFSFPCRDDALQFAMIFDEKVLFCDMQQPDAISVRTKGDAVGK